jgi:predicted lysophospholipase L1 biosynthesis ABC-type transport system permease subunit
VQSALNRLGASAALPNETSATGLPALLSGLGTSLVVARSQLAIGAAILLVIAGATLALATVMLSGQRRGEVALLRSRGASRWQVAGSGLAETGLLILPAVVAGPVLGGLLLPPLAGHGPLRGRTAAGSRWPAATSRP